MTDTEPSAGTHGAAEVREARLRAELEARDRELAEAVEQQTATSEILRVISRSPAEVPFDTIAATARRLCDAVLANIFTFDGELVHIAALSIPDPDQREAVRRLYPRPPDRSQASTRAVLTRRVVTIHDTNADPDYALKRFGFRSLLGVPLMRDGTPIGAIVVGRRDPGPFPERQIALLQTFADQTVIAIENVRLFKELAARTHELEEQGRQLEVASRHKSAFLANMSHELRTPLNAIIGFTRIVMRRSQDRLEPQQYGNLEKILASAHDLLSLINAVLDLAKVEAGRVEIDAGEVELAPVLEQCLRTVEPLVKEEVTLVEAFDPELPSMVVDEEKLRRIVMNLLSNAAKYTSRGSIQLRALPVSGSVEISVRDTGIGIPGEKLDLVFEEFEQADARTTREFGGTGLGLAIARRLARLMGGDIRAESVLGLGSTFTLTLPFHYRRSPP